MRSDDRPAAVGEEFVHRLATMLECSLLDLAGSFDEACALLDEYRAACRAAAPEAPTFMGEPALPAVRSASQETGS